jgi:8-oxo-dGTP pyrophosphatase MutT (NUDIX family)
LGLAALTPGRGHAGILPGVARILHERSAGGVLLVPVGMVLLVALIVLRKGTVLALPKGHIEPGGRPEDTARRETLEETGLLGAIVAPLQEISYWYYSRQQSARIAKRVAFYLLVYRSGSPARHNWEVEGVRLVPLAEAAGRLAYRGEREVMRQAEVRVRDMAGFRPSAANEGAAEQPSPSALLQTGGQLCTP